jgi:hypothetical protein
MRKGHSKAGLFILAVFMMLPVSLSTVGQKRNVQRTQDLNALIEKAKALDEKVYPPYVSGGSMPSNDDFIAFRDKVNEWAKRYKVRLQLMRDYRPLRFRGESMVTPYFPYLVSFYGMTCFRTGFEFSHSTFMGYYSCVP